MVSVISVVFIGKLSRPVEISALELGAVGIAAEELDIADNAALDFWTETNVEWPLDRADVVGSSGV